MVNIFLIDLILSPHVDDYGVSEEDVHVVYLWMFLLVLVHLVQALV